MDFTPKVIPKSTNPSRIFENIEINDFRLEKAEIDFLLALDIADGKGRGFVFENCTNHPHYPFLDEF